MTTETLETETTAAAAMRGTVSYADLWKHAVALVIEYRRMGVTRVVAGHAPEGSDPDLFRAYKVILDGQEYRRIAKLDRRIRARLLKLGLPITSYMKGATVIPTELIEHAEDLLDQYLAERKGAVQAFIQAYPALIQRAQARLGPLYDPTNYPSVETLPELFSVSIRYLTFDMPGVLQHCSERARKRALEEGQVQLTEAVEEMQGYLRETMAGLIGHLREKLTPDPVTGEAKVFKAASMNNLLEFLDTFSAKNLVAQDQTLTTLVQQARQLLNGVELPILRKDEAMRNVIRAGLDDLAAQMDTLLVKRPPRQYVWGDEEG
ncbi:MAG: hypothetical protein AB1411_15705 [Nitrospirota bacterium]